ncbi:MAG: adenosylcobinamide-GDP ribazoletransferase [Lachnospiraceae bacterium]
MNVIRSLIIAFSMYSKIPMPRCEWNKKSMRYTMCFFPIVGVVIGCVQYFVGLWCLHTGVSTLFMASVLTIIPVFITGGIHVDGFIDTSDALHSYQSKERKLEIMKDPHVGAFAIISTIIYFIASIGIMAEMTRSSLHLVIWGYFVSRTLSGLSIVLFPCAKNSGLAATFADGAAKKTTAIILTIYLSIGIIGIITTNQQIGWLIGAGVLAFFLYYRNMAKKNFGGITGDLAGWFLQVCELFIAGMAVIFHLILR